MYCELLFVFFVAIIYAEPLITHLTGKSISTVLLAIAGLGLCSVMAVFFAEAM